MYAEICPTGAHTCSACADRCDPDLEGGALVRKNSKKQTAASRANGAKSKGPESADGKQKSRLNALKDGFFSRNVVVTAAGERVKEYERFKAWVWDSVHPDGAFEEILANDVVENWWRRRRVRCCESAELQHRLENLKTHDLYLRCDETEPLKVRFQLALDRYQATNASTPSEDLNEIVTELEQARSQLVSTPLGLEFLIKKVDSAKKIAESTGWISPAFERVLLACAGVMNDCALFANLVNWCNKVISEKAAERGQAGQGGGTGPTEENEPKKSKVDRSGGKTQAGESKAESRTMQAVLVDAIEDVARELRHRKQLLELNEKFQGKTRFAAAVLPDDATCERLSRAETTFDRRLYRALGALLAIKGGKDAPKSLPGG